jgi:hypothetical protein
VPVIKLAFSAYFFLDNVNEWLQDEINKIKNKALAIFILNHFKSQKSTNIFIKMAKTQPILV